MTNFSKQGRGNPFDGPQVTMSKTVLILSLFLFVLGISVDVFAQQNKSKQNLTISQTGISGVVRERSGEAIIGATVKVKGTNLGVITDLNGRFSFPVIKVKSTIEISYLGYITKEADIEPGVPLVVMLDTKNSELNEVVVVGYGTQKKISVTGALSTISSEQMLKAPVINASQALVGRISGITTRQGSGQPGNDDVNIRIRGRGTFSDSYGALVIVDGVERSYNQLDMNEIETMTVLKDAASTAVYGVRGANGVIVVTTKKGIEGPAKVSYTANMGINKPTRLPKYANSYDYATLWNEGQKNDNPLLTPSQLMFSADDLQKYKDHSDPLFHPDVDWYKAVMNDYSVQQQHNVNVSGGSKFARYYVSLGFSEQDGLYKNFNSQYNYSNNDNYKRFNLRSNVDVSLTKTTTLNFNISSRTGMKNRGSDGFYGSLVGMAPYLTPGVYDGKLIYLNGKYARNPIQAMSTGYSRYTDNNATTTFGITQKLDFVTKGLSVRGKYSYDTGYTYSISRSRTPAIYTPKDTLINGVSQVVYRLYQSIDESVGGLSSTTYSGRFIKEYVEAAISYDRSFGKHSVTALMLYNQSKSRMNVPTPVGVPVSYLGIVARATYNYDSRYLLEFNLGRNGSENFPVGSRFGIFPALSLGWVVTNEPFFANLVSPEIVDHLKLRASYGEVGNDGGTARFIYYPNAYISGTGAVFGENYSTLAAYQEDRLGNPLVTWEKARKKDFGFDLKMFDHRLFFNFDYFSESRNDILTTPSTLPTMYAATPPMMNIGIVRNQGFDFDLGWDSNIGSVNYYLKSNYSFSRNKVIFRDEAIDILNPYLARTGRRMDQPFGYKFLGFFKDNDDITSSPAQFSGKSYPGDCKYADINGDGVITEKDQIPMGYPTYPEIGFGLDGGLSYKGFEFSFLFQGVTNVSVQLGGIMQQPMLIGGEMLASVKDERWTPETANTATRPRLTVSYSNNSNYLASDLWLRDASYIRLKNVELAYRFAGKTLKKIGVSALRVFVQGQNLYTWDKLKIVDPENGQTGSLSYPQLMVFNSGLSLQF